MMKMHTRRKVLSADEITSATGVEPHLEMGDDKLGVYFFSIDCMLQGQRIQGALFAGEMMMVPAPNMQTARNMAKEGLDKTISLLYEEHFTRPLREAQNDEDYIIDVGGRKFGDNIEPLNPLMEEKMKLIITDKLKEK